MDEQTTLVRVEYECPIPSHATKPDVWAFAEQQRERARFSNGFQLHDLVHQNGGEISYLDFTDADQTDAILIEPNGKFVIKLSAHTGVLRDHFTIAHELGHKLLHWPLVKRKHPTKGMRATRRIDKSNSDLMRCEWEANWFASAFLMPKTEFTKAYHNGVASETFGVTPAAVAVRAKSLGLKV